MCEKEYTYQQKTVSIGGGSGQFAWLRGVTKYNLPNYNTAIASTWDSGGKSEEDRISEGTLPQGDYLQCILGCMEDEEQFKEALIILRDRSGGHPLLHEMAAKSENYAVQARAETYKETLAMSGNDGVETGPSAKESNIIKESAETLAMVLSSTNDESDFTTTLRVMIASRLTSCANEEMLANIQALLATGEVANLIEANELSVRCTE